ncbi:MAG: tRNA (cytidine(34)-2'-O)-methyltransferase [Zetaproteobacteria bacterium]|nr:MAG: tRNA (cytidine(34)-2'-O)-methyltransferase [Zetaproteobacteria bacterium]
MEIALVRPQIPPNTGNVARLCACTGACLHLVGPLGFSLDDRHLRRAGLDYWAHLDVRVHADWRAFKEAIAGRRLVGFSAHANTIFWDFAFKKGDVLVFGSETRGLHDEARSSLDALVRLPMRRDRKVRSLNLASSVAAAAFEALRQLRGVWGI